MIHINNKYLKKNYLIKYNAFLSIYIDQLNIDICDYMKRII